MARFGVGLGLAALAVLAVALLSSCSSGSSDQAKAGPLVRVSERDFRITLAPARVRAGDVRVLLRNKGPDAHELILVRSAGGPLPLHSDGFTIDEELLDHATVVTVEPQPAGTIDELHLHLEPGRYELYCNMAGHYLGGMHAELVVT
jgi:uncharacterized cupredoxin-like copper-binding protein